jgi:hypothetical protein
VSRGIDRALVGLALGRLALGAASRTSPRGTAQAFGSADKMTPELGYMTRVFGIRAIALGAGYLASRGEARKLWQRLAFVCDISDTLAGAGDLRRGEMDRGPALQTTALTGAYMLVGAAKVAQDVKAAA